MRYDELEYRVLREALEWILERCAEDPYGTDDEICRRARAALRLADLIRGEDG